jgi:hypothetical protein
LPSAEEKKKAYQVALRKQIEKKQALAKSRKEQEEEEDKKLERSIEEYNETMRLRGMAENAKSHDRVSPKPP